MSYDLRTSEIIYQEPTRSKGQIRRGWRHTTARLLGGILLVAACSAPTPSTTATPAPSASAKPSPSPSASPTATPIPPSPTPTATPTPPSRALRDLEPNEALHLLSEFRIPISSLDMRMVFSPVRPILYHTPVRREIQGYDFEAERVVFQIQGFQEVPQALVVSAEGDRIIAADGPALGIWDLATSERIGSLQMPGIFVPLNAGFVGEGAFYADDESGNIALWETAHWAEVARFSYQGRGDGAFVLPGAEAVVMQIRDRRELRVVDWPGQLVRTIPIDALPWRLHGISPQGDRAVLHVDTTMGSEGVLITDLAEDGTVIRFPLLNIRAIAVSADWRTLAVADAANVLRLVDPSTGEQYYTQPLEAFQIQGLAISPDGAYLGVYLRKEGESGGYIQIWGRQPP